MDKVLQNMPLSKFLFAQMSSSVSDKEIISGLSGDFCPICTITTIIDTTYRVITVGVKQNYKNYEKPTTYLIPDGYSPIVRIFNPINIMINADSDGLGFVNYYVMSNGNIALTEIVPTSKYQYYSVTIKTFSGVTSKAGAYYSIDNGTNWVEITATGIIVPKGRQVKFKVDIAGVPSNNITLDSTQLGVHLIAHSDTSIGPDTDISSNKILTQNVNDIVISQQMDS